jgi:hypothetical protein
MPIVADMDVYALFDSPPEPVTRSGGGADDRAPRARRIDFVQRDAHNAPLRVKRRRVPTCINA